METVLVPSTEVDDIIVELEGLLSEKTSKAEYFHRTWILLYFHSSVHVLPMKQSYPGEEQPSTEHISLEH